MGLDERSDVALIIAATRVSIAITYFCIGLTSVNRRLMDFGEATSESEADYCPVPLVRADKLDALSNGPVLD